MPLTPKTTPPYYETQNSITMETYTALASQAYSSQVSGTLTIGTRYIVPTLQAGDDFSNVGYVSDGTPFTAIATTPIDWTHFTIAEEMLPLETDVLINKIGTITWTNPDVGEYRGHCVGKFLENKVTFPPMNPTLDNYLPIAGATTDEYQYSMGRVDDDTIKIFVCKQDYTPTQLANIMIRPLLIQINKYN